MHNARLWDCHNSGLFGFGVGSAQCERAQEELDSLLANDTFTWEAHILCMLYVSPAQIKAYFTQVHLLISYILIDCMLDS